MLDVGCGPGALTEHLARTLGSDRVCAADPSPPFVEASAARAAGADVRQAGAEQLPWPDATFDFVLSQLVVNFMSDRLQGVREMRRVTRDRGVIAACTWDYGSAMEISTHSGVPPAPSIPTRPPRAIACDSSARKSFAASGRRSA